MYSYESLLTVRHFKLKPKDSYKLIRKYYKRTDKNLSQYEFMCKTREALSNLSPKSYVLQITDGRSIESIFYSVVQDSTGYYMLDNTNIKRFRNKKNVLKYKLSKEMLQRFSHTDTVNFYCFEYNPSSSRCTENEYVNLSFHYGRKVTL